jgi:hypothetical protein
MDLAHYYEITHHEEVRRILSRLAAYLATGVTERGSSRYNCFKEYPEVNYWTAALAAALLWARRIGLGAYQDLSTRAYHHLLSRQNDDGSFDFSKKNYRFLSDRQSYPRQLAMVLHFLLLKAQDQ